MLTTYSEAVEKFFVIEKTDNYTLDNIITWTKAIWNPQNDFRIIHIAWTNGKGSVSKMCFSVLKKAGKKVWVFTSPHLIDLRERFETDEWLITKEEFLDIMNYILSFDLELSYFDRCVMIALEFFLWICDFGSMNVS